MPDVLTSDPLPCPFCGLTDVQVVQGDTFRWRVAVCSCGARAPDVRIQTIGEGTQQEYEESAARAALEAWNTRATT